MATMVQGNQANQAALPRSSEGFYYDARERIALHRAQRDSRLARRDHRLGRTSAHDLRATLKAHARVVDQSESRAARLREHYTLPSGQ